MGWKNFIKNKANEGGLQIDTSIVNFQNIDLPLGSLTHYTFPQNIESVFRDKALKARTNKNGKGFSPYQCNESDMALSLNLFLTDQNKNEFNSIGSTDITEYLQIKDYFNYAGDATNPHFDYGVYFKRSFRPKAYFLFDNRLNQLIASESEPIPNEKEVEYNWGWSGEYALRGIKSVRAYEKLRSGKTLEKEIEEVNKAYNLSYGLRVVRIEKGKLVPMDVPTELVETILSDDTQEQFLLQLENDYSVREALDPSEEEITRLVNKTFKESPFSYRQPQNVLDQKVKEYDLLGANPSRIVDRILEAKNKRNSMNLVEVLQEIEKVKFLRENYYRFNEEKGEEMTRYRPWELEHPDSIFSNIYFSWLHKMKNKF